MFIGNIFPHKFSGYKDFRGTDCLLWSLDLIIEGHSFTAVTVFGDLFSPHPKIFFKCLKRGSFIQSDSLPIDLSKTTNLLAPGALAHPLHRLTTYNAAEANLDSPNQKTKFTSL